MQDQVWGTDENVLVRVCSQWIVGIVDSIAKRSVWTDHNANTMSALEKLCTLWLLLKLVNPCLCGTSKYNKAHGTQIKGKLIIQHQKIKANLSPQVIFTRDFLVSIAKSILSSRNAFCMFFVHRSKHHLDGLDTVWFYLPSNELQLLMGLWISMSFKMLYHTLLSEKFSL